MGLEFQYLFDLPEALQGLLPDFRYLLCDLTQYRDEDIRGAVTLKVAFLLMKHIFSNDLVDRLPGILELLRDLLNKRSGLEYLETVSQTLRNRLKEIDDPDVLKSLHKKALHAGSLEQFKDGVQDVLM